MRIAIEGCSHGELNNIYASIAKAEEQGNFKTDVLLLCGDMQALRNRADLECLAVPQKYRQMGDFHEYYSGEKRAPLLTLVIGGNHEASNYMFELYHGGWLAPNIYFLGEAGVVDVGGLIIAGTSGIYKSHDYTCGRFERMPLGPRDIRSIYHTRVFDTWRLKLMQGAPQARPHIVMSHDWPNTVEQHGDTAWLIKNKPYFKDEINTRTLGSPPLMELLETLQPQYWFSAHLHVKFAALVKHGRGDVNASSSLNDLNASSSSSAANPEALDIDIDEDDADADADANPDELDIDVDDVEDEEPKGSSSCKHAHDVEDGIAHATSDEAVNSTSLPATTRFLALSKCLPNHDFLQFIDVDVGGEAATQTTSTADPSFTSLRFVPRWLAILRATNHLLSLQRSQPALPSISDAAFEAEIARQEQWVNDTLVQPHDNASDGSHPLDIARIQQFHPTAPPTNTPIGRLRNPPLQWYTNPQTESLTAWLQIENKINKPEVQGDGAGHSAPVPLMRFAPEAQGGGGAAHPAAMPPMRFAAPPHQQQQQHGLPQPHHYFTGHSQPPAPPHLLHNDLSNPHLQHQQQHHGPPLPPDEDEEIRRIEAAAQRATAARKRAKVGHTPQVPSESVSAPNDDEPLRLDDDDELNARWKEGTG